jgi:NAD(P)-dependent dehydrogenase (short-subunit alcohol dehydrogenase family)
MKRVFLTGASSGIGLATAQALLARGDEVWGTSRNPASLLRHERFHPVELDLAKNDQIEATFARAVSEAGHFDVHINNAGGGHFGPAELLSVPEIQEQFQVLFFGHVRLTQIALAHMRERGQGLIINVTSLASLLPVPFMAAYNAAKSAMASFTMSLQLELGNSPVRLVDVQPGDIRTRFNDVIRRGNDNGYEESAAKTWKAVDHNMKVAPPPEVVARQIVKLVDQQKPPKRVIVGDAFQTQIAPFIFRFLPQRTRLWGLKKYYGI